MVIKMVGEQVIGREGEGGEQGCALGREGEGRVPGRVYRGIRSCQAEESISETREVKVEASVMGSESEKKLERGELTRVESAVMEGTEKEGVEDMLRHLRASLSVGS